MAKVVVSLGGNALGKSPAEQLELVKNTVASLIGLISSGNEVVISHGNGPQVGQINLGMSYAAEHGQFCGKRTGHGGGGRADRGTAGQSRVAAGQL